MSTLIYPGTQVQFEVPPMRVDAEGVLFTVDNPDNANHWAVYARPRPEGLAVWVADFQTETDAREYAAWRAKRH